MISLYATAFASYAKSLLPDRSWALVGHLLVSGGMVIFVDYDGFEFVANATKDVPTTHATKGLLSLDRVCHSVVRGGGRSHSERSRSSRFITPARTFLALSRPALGQFGFVLAAVASLLSTTSAINATLYGTARLSWLLARGKCRVPSQRSCGIVRSRECWPPRHLRSLSPTCST